MTIFQVNVIDISMISEDPLSLMTGYTPTFDSLEKAVKHAQNEVAEFCDHPNPPMLMKWENRGNGYMVCESVDDLYIEIIRAEVY